MSIPTAAMTLTPKHAEPPSLVMKLAEVMAAVERIPKRGTNEFHHYVYATEADIVDAVRHELAKRHVMIIPSVTKVTREGTLTTLEMLFTIYDGQTGDNLSIPWAGVGDDKSDKGIWKAITGAVKYCLLKTFLIPTGDDPEQEEAAEKKPAPRPKPAPADRPPTDPDDPLPPAALPAGAAYITKIDPKKGTSKTGKPYTKFLITDSMGRESSTFSESLAKLAAQCRDKRTPVVLTMESTKFGNDLTEIAFAVREPGQEG